jgi:hypothetical protein
VPALTPRQITAYKRSRTRDEARAKVVAELSRRGYLVPSVEGSTGLLTVATRKGQKFRVAVSGQAAGKNAWLTRTRAIDPDLYYVCIYMPPSKTGDLFFIFNQAEHEKGVERYLAKYGTNQNKTGGGFGWKDALRFQEKWCTLPGP